MRETKFLQVHFLLFWLLPTLWFYHFHCYSMSFLLIYLSSTLIPCIAILIPHIFCIFIQIPCIPKLHSLAPGFPSNSSHPHPYSLHFPHSILQFSILDFTDSLLSLQSLRIYFRKIVALVQKRTLPFVTTA